MNNSKSKLTKLNLIQSFCKIFKITFLNLTFARINYWNQTFSCLNTPQNLFKASSFNLILQIFTKILNVKYSQLPWNYIPLLFDTTSIFVINIRSILFTYQKADIALHQFAGGNHQFQTHFFNSLGYFI